MDRQYVTVVRQVLDGLRFPAQRWQVITQGEIYGADRVTMAKLHELPVRLYVNCDDVTAEILTTRRLGRTVAMPIVVDARQMATRPLDARARP